MLRSLVATSAAPDRVPMVTLRQIPLQVAVLALLGCGASGPGPAPLAGQSIHLTEPTRLCVGGATAAADCRSPREIERWLEAERLEIVGRRDTVGAQGAAALTLRAGDAIFDAKWRAAAGATADNNPMGELGAHRVQALVLDPSDYVVPPAASHCFTATEYVRWFGTDDSVADMECVLGFLSYWLTGSVGLGEARRDGLVVGSSGDPWHADPALYEPARFARQSRAYRTNVAHLNLIAFLVHNGDAHAAQFVVYPRPLHVFLVDHSVSFSAPERASMRGRQSFAELVVPAIPADTAARIAGLGPDDVAGLMRLEEHRRTGGEWRRAAPGSLLHDGRGRVRREGDRVQVGLSRDDTHGVLERLGAVRRALREGTLGTFE